MLLAPLEVEPPSALLVETLVVVDEPLVVGVPPTLVVDPPVVVLPAPLAVVPVVSFVALPGDPSDPPAQALAATS